MNPSGAELRSELTPVRREERAAVLAEMVHDEEKVNVPEVHKGEEVDVAPPGVPVGANAEVMQLAVEIR